LSEWRHALLRYVRSGHPDLTNRQMALLLVVGREGGLHTVRGLAARLGVSKPVVTRALNSLTALDMVARRVDERDRRSVFIDLTPEGEVFLIAFEALLGDDSGDLN
jgi:DNA-binding MarR family transcriptional regulator